MKLHQLSVDVRIGFVGSPANMCNKALYDEPKETGTEDVEGLKTLSLLPRLWKLGVLHELHLHACS